MKCQICSILCSIPLTVLVTFTVDAQTRFQKCAKAGVQLDASGRHSISRSIHFRTEEAFNRCMEQARRSGGGSAASIAPARAASANLVGASLPSVSSAKTAVAGHSLKLDHFVSVNPDCSPRGAPQIRVIGAPAHGKISTARAVDFAKGFSGAYAACAQARTSGTTASYTARSGFSGQDVVRLLVIYSSGNTTQGTYSLTVVR